jgi:hypothetical protein
MKKIKNILLSTLLLAAACTDENLPDNNFAIIVDSEHCSVEGSFVQGSPLNEYCKAIIPYSNAQGNELVTIQSEKVNGIEIVQQTVTLTGSEGVIAATITGTPVALQSTFLPVNITLNNATYIVGVEVPVASDPNPNGEVVFTMDETPVVSISGLTERTFTVSPTMASVVATNIPAGLLVAITQDLEQGSGTVTYTPLAALLSGNVEFTATFGARPVKQKNVFITVFSNGDGSVLNPYEVNSADLLAKMAAGTGLSSAFKLVNNVTINAWTPVGASATPFTGVLDGNNKTVTLNINTPAADNVAFFAYLGAAAVVKNLTLSGSVTGQNYVAALAANSESGSVTGVTSDAVITGVNYIAQLVANGTGKDAGILSFGTVPSVINIMAGQQSATEKLGIGTSGASVTFNAGTTGTSISYNNTNDDITVTKPNLNNDGFTPGNITFTAKLAGSGAGVRVNSASRTSNGQSMAMYESGTGVSGDPYIVINAAQLAMTVATYPAAYIALGANVNLASWETVASYAGNLDGQGHAATGLKTPFVNLNAGSIKNMKFTGVDITSTGFIGAVARTNTGTVSGVAVVGTITGTSTGDNPLGGIAGENNNGGIVNNCYVNAILASGGNAVGGIVGRINNGSGFTNATNEIKNCTSEGSMSAAGTQIGGILGRKTNANNNTAKPDSIANCNSAMNVDGTGGSNMAGGIFGAHQANNTSPAIITIQQCLFTGTVSASNSVGGIGGVAPEIADCIVVGQGATAATGMLRMTTGGSGASGSSGGIASAAKGNVTRCIVANARIGGFTTNAKISGGIVSAQNNGTPAINACVIINSKLDAAAAQAIAGTPASLTLNNNYRSNVLNLTDTDFTGNSITDVDGAIAPATMDQAWYTGLGYNFTAVWEWDTANSRPKLRNVGCANTVKP